MSLLNDRPSHFLRPSTARLLESAAEELARLDELCTIAPPAVAIALQAEIVARLADSQAMSARSAPHALPHPAPRSATAHWSALVSAAVDAVHVDACPQQLPRFQDLVRAEERRARSGAPLTVARVLGYVDSIALSDATPRDLEPIDLAPIDLDALDQALRPGGQPRPALMRAVGAAAAIPRGAIAELVPGLLLCSTGLTDRLRLLPFAGVDAAARTDALVALHAGDAELFTSELLNACAEDARSRRVALRSALSAIASDEEHLAPLGRAAITARRALGVLRESLATSMPQLSLQLECSRPAAGDALERLVEAGLAVEITGRQRDRVYACARAYSVVPAT